MLVVEGVLAGPGDEALELERVDGRRVEAEGVLRASREHRAGSEVGTDASDGRLHLLRPRARRVRSPVRLGELAGGDGAARQHDERGEHDALSGTQGVLVARLERPQDSDGHVLQCDAR